MLQLPAVFYEKAVTEYRRFYMPKAMWFFTVNLAERKNNVLLIDKIDELRNAFRYVKQRKPFHIDAIVIMPDHLHSTCMDAGGRATHGAVAEHLDITA